MSDIKIIVATHKKYWLPQDSVYLPLHAGAEESNFDLGILKDNTGDNISFKNKNYCELTALYWAWKNLHCEYIGLCHYKRYFAHKSVLGKLLTKKDTVYRYADYEKLLQKYDVILPTKRNYYIETVRSHYTHAHHKRDLDETEKIIAEKYPEYADTFKIVMNRTKLHLYNMFVMKKELFDEYCRWLFDIIFELEKRIDISDYDAYNARIYGFLAERLFNIWLEKQHLRTVEVPIVTLEPINWGSKIARFLKRKYQ